MHHFPLAHGPLARYVILRDAPERFLRHRELTISTCITARAWRLCREACRDRWLAISFEVGKRSRHSWRLRNPQFCVSGKRPILTLISNNLWRHGSWLSLFNWYPATCGPFDWHGLTLVQIWISNQMPGKVWDELLIHARIKIKLC